MSKYIELTEHSYLCKQQDDSFMPNFCEFNPEIFVCLLNAEFIVLKVPSCQTHGSNIDYIEGIIKQVKKIKKLDEIRLRRSIKDNDLRDLRIRGVELDNSYCEVSYCYKSCSTVYYLCSEMELNYNLVSNYNEKLNHSYSSILNKINGTCNEKYIKQELKELYQINIINDWTTDLERIKTVDVLIKKLKRNETSKQ